MKRRPPAVAFVAASDVRFAVTARPSEAPSLDSLLSLWFTDVDFVLVEGYRTSTLPELEVHRACLGSPLSMRDDPHLVAVASDEILATDVPCLDLNRPSEVADFLEAEFLGG